MKTILCVLLVAAVVNGGIIGTRYNQGATISIIESAPYNIISHVSVPEHVIRIVQEKPAVTRPIRVLTEDVLAAIAHGQHSMPEHETGIDRSNDYILKAVVAAKHSQH